MIFVPLVEVSGCPNIESAGLKAKDIKPGWHRQPELNSLGFYLALRLIPEKPGFAQGHFAAFRVLAVGLEQVKGAST
jgi:hypothetical protein